MTLWGGALLSQGWTEKRVQKYLFDYKDCPKSCKSKVKKKKSNIETVNARTQSIMGIKVWRAYLKQEQRVYTLW